MDNYACKKCGSINVKLDNRGEQTALVCSDCLKWIKWVSKKDLASVERYIEENNKQLKVVKDKVLIFSNGVNIIFNSLSEAFFLGDTILDIEDEHNFRLAIQKGLDEIKEGF